MTAASAGLREDDEIVFIDGVDVRDKSPAKVHAMLKGTMGTHVELTVIRKQHILHLRILRGPFRTIKPENGTTSPNKP
jgi:C-terminal processing protease CtpA/Prc